MHVSPATTGRSTSAAGLILYIHTYIHCYCMEVQKDAVTHGGSLREGRTRRWRWEVQWGIALGAAERRKESRAGRPASKAIVENSAQTNLNRHVHFLHRQNGAVFVNCMQMHHVRM